MSLLKRNRKSIGLKRTKSKSFDEGYSVKDLPSLRRKRTMAFNRMSKAFEIATKARTDESERDLFFAYYDELKNITYSFEDAHLNILEISDIPEDDHDLYVERFDNMYFEINSIHRTLTKGEVGSFAHSTRDRRNAASSSAALNVKLPKISMPSFSGNIKHWPEFFDTFNTLIHECPTLSETEKFHYLHSSLSGDALTVIRAFPITSSHYCDAYQALIARYQGKRELSFTCWKEILEISFKTNHAHDFRHALDLLEENLCILKKLELPVQHWDFILNYHILSKLDTQLRREFEQNHFEVELPSYEQMKIFLHSKCEALIRDTHFSASNKSVHNTVVPKTKPSVYDRVVLSKPNPSSVSHSLIAASEEANELTSVSTLKPTTMPKCVFCGEPHSIIFCKSFLDRSIEERIAIANERNWCFNCLRSSHQLKNCVSTFSCQKCRRKHHTLLHKTVNSEPKIETKTESVSLVVRESSRPASARTNTTVLLATAIVQVKDVTGFHSFRALFDTGSQNNFITEHAVRRLKLQQSASSSTSIHGLGGVEAKISGMIKCAIGVNNQCYFNLDMYVIPKICGDQPIAKLNTSGWSHIKSLPLADPGFDIPGPVDLLLGADVFAESLRAERMKGNAIQPPALNSIFGWLLLGRTPLASACLLQFQSNADSSLSSIVEKFWESEAIPQASTLNPDEILCESKFKSNHYRDDTGRYIVQLPFKNDVEPTFEGSRDIALRRFHAIERRLSRDPELYSQYREFMADYLKTNHMTLLPAKSLGLGKYYIPHHCILRPDSTTTKLRVVFDASAKDLHGKSLNDTLLTGPKLQSNIFDILLHFREYAVVFMADVRQMYRQILVAKPHRDYQRIFWRNCSTEPLQEYELNTVTYGVSSAPFLACRAVQQLAVDEGESYPLAKRILKSEIYIDDVVSGCNSLEEALQARSQLINLFNLGKFELRKWASNEPQLLADLPAEDCLSGAISFNDTKPSALKVLGLKWDPSSDMFRFDVQPSNQPCTKRSILSELARIFDPLGFLSPLTIQAKCFIQSLWILGVTWDDAPPEEIARSWTKYLQQLPSLQNLSIPRRLTCNKATSYDLHGFCDSSETAYGAVIYIRFTDDNDAINVFFVSAKARVAPIKKVSLPRLELCAAVLLSDLLKSVKITYEERIPIQNIFLWSDSTIVLSWLRSHSSRWTTYVANRVSHIHDIAPTDWWHHVASVDNPADVCSRGQFPNDLLHNKLWWMGPAWLSQSPDHWPTRSQEGLAETELVRAEERRTVALVTDERSPKGQKMIEVYSPIDQLLKRFSSLDKITRILTHIRRFIHNVRSPNSRQQGFVTEEERHKSLLVIVKHVQSNVFSEEILKLHSRKPLAKPFQKLNPFLDDQGIVRVGGRISHSGLAYEHKHPALIPGDCHLTTRIIENIHQKHCHPGLNTTQYLIMQQFWIMSAKRAIRRCLAKCIRCYRVRPRPLQPFMSDLPSFRVNQAKPFSEVGIDFGGPFRIKSGTHRGAKINKAYLCLFVCLATKAVHLEVASTLSTEGFLAALCRFIGRRGRCNRIHADCGTNFVGAHNQLSPLMQNAAQSERIEFSFNPPSAPHFGGVWEIQIKAAKSHLYRVVGEQILTFEELTTLFVQIESVLNSRPLCPLSSDPNDLNALTPGHFLTLEPLTAVPDPDYSNIKLYRLNRWQLIQSFHQSFWARWRNEYLHSLTQRAKWTKESKPLQINTLVIIKDDNRPPLHWPLGRVIDLHPGPDGTVRVATVRTTSHVLKRPLVKLCPLPVEVTSN